VGILAYFIFRGNEMRAHQIQASQDQEQFVRGYIQHAAGHGPSMADEISKLVDLKNNGVITEAEFERMKAHVISQASASSSSTGGSP
jgi:NifU-like protein involved in Fe-S cluster formation